jgi:lysozyme
MSKVPANVSERVFQRLTALEGSLPYVYDDQDRSYPKKRLTSYTAAKGYPTIGIGHLVRPPEYDRFRPYLSDKKLTAAQIEALFQEDIKRISAPLRKKIKGPITQSMWDALVLQAFNTGPYTKSLSAAIDAINAQDKAGARAALLRAPTTSKGKVVPHLVARRKEEADLFMQEGPPSGPMADIAPTAPLAPTTPPDGRAPHRARLQAQRRKRTRRALIVGAAALALVSALALRETLKQ